MVVLGVEVGDDIIQAESTHLDASLGPVRALPGQVLGQGIPPTVEKKGSKSLSPSPLKPRKTIAVPTFIWISPSKNPARMIQATLLISSASKPPHLCSGVRL